MGHDVEHAPLHKNMVMAAVKGAGWRAAWGQARLPPEPQPGPNGGGVLKHAVRLGRTPSGLRGGEGAHGTNGVGGVGGGGVGTRPRVGGI